MEWEERIVELSSELRWSLEGNDVYFIYDHISIESTPQTRTVLIPDEKRTFDGMKSAPHFLSIDF